MMLTKNNNSKGIVGYLIIAFGLAWLLWLIPAALGVLPGNPLFQLVILPGAFAPAVAAVIVRKWVTKEGFADAGLRPNLRQKWSYYLMGWLLPLPVVGIIVILAIVLGVSQPDFSLQRVLPPEATIPDWLSSIIWLVIPVQLMVVTLIATPILWGEEFGWRGYLQLRLFGDRPLLAAIVTGLIWGVWHYPINLMGYNYPDAPILGLFAFPVSTILLSIIFGWLRLRTGDIWSPSLAHAANNAIGGSLTVLIFAGGPNMSFVTYLGILSWIPLGAMCAWIVLSGQLSAPLAESRVLKPTA